VPAAHGDAATACVHTGAAASRPACCCCQQVPRAAVNQPNTAAPAPEAAAAAVLAQLLGLVRQALASPAGGSSSSSSSSSSSKCASPAAAAGCVRCPACAAVEPTPAPQLARAGTCCQLAALNAAANSSRLSHGQQQHWAQQHTSPCCSPTRVSSSAPVPTSCVGEQFATPSSPQHCSCCAAGSAAHWGQHL
jgi:hypothetical protein